MKDLFGNLNKESTFDDFRAEHKRVFGYDYYENSDEIPCGKIAEANNEWVYYDSSVCEISLWIDDGDSAVEYIK